MLTSRIAVILGSVLLFAVVSLAAFWGWSERTRYMDLYESEKVLREATESRLKGIQSDLRTIGSKYATSELRLRQVLEAIPDRRTPPAVYNELCARANCAKLDPMQAPTN